MTTACVQQRIKKIAGKSLFTKVLADFLYVFYLLALVPKLRNFSYTHTLACIKKTLKQKVISLKKIHLLTENEN